jgi:hypothetical protein
MPPTGSTGEPSQRFTPAGIRPAVRAFSQAVHPRRRDSGQMALHAPCHLLPKITLKDVDRCGQLPAAGLCVETPARHGRATVTRQHLS